MIYRCAEIEGNKKLAHDANGKALIETRGQGGYALAPGSPGACHETGRTYEYFSGPQLTELPTITPEERAILFRVATLLDETPKEEVVGNANNPKSGVSRNGNRDGLSPGDDFNQRALWEDILTFPQSAP